VPADHADEARGPKGAAAIALDDLEPYAAGLVCLTGGAQGPLARRLASGDVATAPGGSLGRLVAMFGRSSCFVEIQRHFRRDQEEILQGS
jgi:error-prone DNA polymerase